MINDTINPMSFDITKVLHGHVRVETRDRWTGRVVDSQEKDNIVTNAVQKMLMTLTWASQTSSSPASIWMPLFTKILGGIFLFDGTLVESVENITFPASPKVVAYASTLTADSSNANQGSPNAIESTLTSNGYTNVWDFGTSQANGTIASLARSSGYFNSTGCATTLGIFDMRVGGLGATTPMTYLGYDDANEYVYFALNNTSTATIYRARCNLSKFDLSWMLLPTLNSCEEVLTLTSSSGSTTARYFAYDKYSNNFVYGYNQTTVHIVELDGTHRTITTPGATSNSAFLITENYYWRVTSGTVYRVSKANPSDVTSFTVPTTTAYFMPGDNDLLYYAENSTNIRIYYPDGTYISWALHGNTSEQQNRAVGPFYAYGQTAGSANGNAPRLGATNMYLGTIANLDNPVTKTSSQTMKITYTLTEA